MLTSISFPYIISKNLPTWPDNCANQPRAWGELVQIFFLTKIDTAMTIIDCSFSKNSDVQLSCVHQNHTFFRNKNIASLKQTKEKINVCQPASPTFTYTGIKSPIFDRDDMKKNFEAVSNRSHLWKISQRWHGMWNTPAILICCQLDSFKYFQLTKIFIYSLNFTKDGKTVVWIKFLF